VAELGKYCIGQQGKPHKKFESAKYVATTVGWSIKNINAWLRGRRTKGISGGHFSPWTTISTKYVTLIL
jgi:hypothetical protein